MSTTSLLEELSEFDLPLWAGLDPAARLELQSKLQRIVLPGGEVLFREGDPADVLYMLVSGALGVSVQGDHGEQRRIARIAPSETIGEMALISNAPRSATVTALRDSVLLTLARADFESLIERWPSVMLYLSKLLADRLRAATRFTPVAFTPTTFAIVPVTQGVMVSDFAQAFLAEMRRSHGAGVDLIDAMPHQEDENGLYRFEASRERVIYVAPEPSGAWTERCIRHADHVVLLARPGEPLTCEAEALTNAVSSWRRHDLVLLQKQDARRPAPAHPSLQRLPVNQHLQVREKNLPDLQRLIRTSSGRAVGLVLAGGGARGFAHLGAIRALHEHGIPIDLVGGTSIGAVIAAICAIQIGLDEARDLMMEAFVRSPPLNDYTLPLIALIRGLKVDARLIEHFGERNIEDLWLPFFCISSNLTTGTTHVHRQGTLWRALRASLAIPGLLPPVVEPEGVLVDGAMMNNLPADVMADLQRGPVLGIDVARDVAFTSSGDEEKKAPLLRRILGLPTNAPDIVNLLYRSATISSDAQTLKARAHATLVIHPPLADVPLRGWEQFEKVVDIGYRHTRERIEAGALDPFRLP
ncbi:patatin-like phospholipase family protein [Microvirga tunisiensis]|uniref:Cyclic nucleotide-binding domain-containing protein n=1 Tax=Microvirga tunisiensis TaxID=2108360 RepID=A0A5N7MEL1_9HYPH|nr:patatin-like phospholipase family protein [Microvirga tunisiensis]MPR06432.1 cyclic nucleotide-binding domain-containing protein [Microvirga tunisiensis]MPR24554.1 cyclic nucleotide-binding domain-containing protein [Microvirga tunisiensis]